MSRTTADKPKWTEGEWERDGMNIVVQGRGVICTIPSPRTTGVFDHDANAELIAAAPALAEALRECKRYFTNRPGNEEAQLNEIIGRALAAAGMEE